MDNEEAVFGSEAEAKKAQDEANAKSPREGTVFRVRIVDEMLEPSNEGTQFAVISEDGEWMVSKEDPEWVCVA
jgi:hypothetical protein